ncbi:hypothetical protein KCM76_16105 [Zooshikella marina]|uniref:hypothetical protein n=1 Tax=Zooshikella ganghwensis TaxID=202772 RepID=UPI001BB0D4BA|nr:hypothetical protein [Zooshikella ganghwensis]MBU2707518.1 hypothetical protein [Zooshikella ganghwensis]
MAMQIKGTVGNIPIDLTVTCDEDFQSIVSAILDLCAKQNKNTATAESDTVETESTLANNEVTIAKASSTASSDNDTLLLQRALKYIETENQVTNYQLVNFLSGLKVNEQSIKQTIMRLKHHKHICLTTESSEARSNYLVFHWHTRSE